MTTTDPTPPRTPAEALDLDAIEARANAATPGPWDLDRRPGWATWSIEAPAVDGDSGWTRDVADRLLEPDAEFIAHARQDLPALVAEVRRLRTERDFADRLRDQAAAVREHDRRQAERAILQWAADRLADEPNEYTYGADERGHVVGLLRHWAAELDTAPVVYALPAEPPETVTELWDSAGVRFRRTARLTWEVAQGNTGVPWHERWNWVRLLAKRGPLSSRPPAQEADR